MRRMNPQPLCVYGLNRIFNGVKTIYGVDIWRDAGPSPCGGPSRLVLLSDELCGPRRTRRRKATGATVGGALVAHGDRTEKATGATVGRTWWPRAAGRKSDWCYCQTNCGPRRTRRRKATGATIGRTLVAHGNGTEKSDWCYYRTNSGGPRKQDGEKRLVLLSDELWWPTETGRRKATGATIGRTLVAHGNRTEKSVWRYCRRNSDWKKWRKRGSGVAKGRLARPCQWRTWKMAQPRLI